MLRQNRYKDKDFIHSTHQLEIIKDEILISKEHGIVIGLEPYQVVKFEDLQEFIIKIISKIPELDNETQDFYETISDDTDFPHSLSVIYLDGNQIILDYWSDEVNNQFSVIFDFENDIFKLKNWNYREVALNWRN